MPQPVIDRLVKYQTSEHANIHRAVHYLSETATREYEAARRKAQRFINAREERAVIFTSGTTDGINLVTHGYGRKFIGAGDEIILTTLEHHSNIVPWQMLREEKGAKIRVVPINDAGELDLDEYKRALQRAHEVRRRRARLERARHDQSGQGDDRASRTSTACRCWSTARRPRRTSRSTCRTSTATSTRSRATRCAARPASASSTARPRCSRRCSRSRAAAT